jgi:hypothetical protein
MRSFEKFESKDKGGRVPQSRDASNGHEAVVQLLLAWGMCLVHYKSIFKVTFWSYLGSWFSGHEAR